MKDSLVRICKIELKGFKNTNSGTVEMPSALTEAFFTQKADILGIYGQNGSGKTAVIEAMGFIQYLLMGEPLPKDTVAYISREHESCSIAVTFAIKTERVCAKVVYTVQLKRVDDDSFEISRETLASSPWDGERFGKRKTLLSFTSQEESGRFAPAFRYDALIRSNDENKVNLGVAVKIAQKDRCSVIFGREGRKIFLSAPTEITADYVDIILILHKYSCVSLFVITNTHSGSISMNFVLPFAFRLERGATIAKGDLPVRLDEPSVISKDHYQMVLNIITGMNKVLGTMIPGLSIGVHDFGEQLLENGKGGHKIQLISKRGSITVPLKYESEGIIKIISILNVLICVFNDPSTCLVIDELDAGIYEYLLGELLLIFEKSAKGQLIFTSHNLRPLEMLNKTSIVFSTTNADNRYIRLQNVKTNNNLRDMYLRSITLGGQKEEVYAETDTVEIGRAFRQAGSKAVRDGSEY